MALERKEVEEIALLARIAFAPDELTRMQSELGVILEHFQAIADVDTTDVPPMTHAVPKDMQLRDDTPIASMPPSEALFNAPKREGDLFVVPAIISSGDDS